MSKQREALEAALTEINVHFQPFGRPSAQTQVVINKINEALAEPEQEPSHWATKHGHLAIFASEMGALGIDKSNYMPLTHHPSHANGGS